MLPLTSVVVLYWLIKHCHVFNQVGLTSDKSQTNDKANGSLHIWLCLCTLDILLTYFLGDLRLQPVKSLQRICLKKK